MDIIENKFEMISNEFINDFISELYEPYKVYGNLNELLSNIPKYVIPSKHYDGQINRWEKNGDKSYVIFNPNPDELKKIKDFRAIEIKSKKLIDLRTLQIEYLNKSLSEIEANEIENAIDLLYKEIFEIKYEKLLIDNPPVNINCLFRKEEYFTEIKEMLIENKLIRIVDDKIEWLGSLEEPSLKPLKLLCSLFVVLEKKDYLIQKPSNTLVSKLLSHYFNITISDKIYGNTKNAFAIISDFSKDKEYYDFYHFIPKK